MIPVTFTGEGLMALCRALEAETERTVATVRRLGSDISADERGYLQGLMSALESMRDACQGHAAANDMGLQ